MNLMKKFSGQYLVILMFSIFLSFSIITGFIFQYVKIREYKAEISTINDSIKKTKKEIETLKNTNTKSSSLEEIARQRLNMVKPEETVYIDIGRE